MLRRGAYSTAGFFDGQLQLLTRTGPSATALLFHRFFAESETRRAGIDRLRRNLDWLCSKFFPISLPEFVAGQRQGSLPDSAVLVTTDDAELDLLEVAEEFAKYKTPLSIFACAGWTAIASAGTGVDLLARATANIAWYEGDEVEVSFGSRRMTLRRDLKDRNIDSLIAEREHVLPCLEELCVKIEHLALRDPRCGVLASRKARCCTWEQLRCLASAGVSISAHSVTHVNLSQTSPVRCKFEIAESKHLCEALVARCDAFAYPYGGSQYHSQTTRRELESSGFTAAFLTRPDFITISSDAMTLPRIAVPDEPISAAAFRAYVCGAPVLVNRVKQTVRRDW
ncbi:peptidoglycan/xylan/chitin deacetylase (PgdA/CDA1 family) [Bradyrhizobium sp. USDA 4474]